MSTEPSLTVEPIDFPTDGRGLVLEPLRPDEFAGQHNAHLAITRPGCVRGNHYHEHGTEVMAVLGPALVRVRVAGVDQDYVVENGRAMRFTFPPGMAHAMKNTGSEPQVSVSFNTSAHDRNRPDVIRSVLIPSDPS